MLSHIKGIFSSFSGKPGGNDQIWQNSAKIGRIWQSLAEFLLLLPAEFGGGTEKEKEKEKEEKIPICVKV